MGTIIIPNAVVREPNFLYYIDKFGNICRAAMVHNGRGKKKKKKKA